MYGVTSEEIVESVEVLIKDYGMTPFNAYCMVYEKSSETAEFLEEVSRVKLRLIERREAMERVRKSNKISSSSNKHE